MYLRGNAELQKQGSHYKSSTKAKKAANNSGHYAQEAIQNKLVNLKISLLISQRCNFSPSFVQADCLIARYTKSNWYLQTNFGSTVREINRKRHMRICKGSSELTCSKLSSQYSHEQLGECFCFQLEIDGFQFIKIVK